MSKHKKPHRKRTKKSERRPAKVQPNLEAKSRFGVRLWRCVLASATLLGGATFFFLAPRPSVSPTGPALANPFDSSFTITNENIIPLRQVGTSMAVNSVMGSASTFNETNRPPVDPKKLSLITKKEWNNHALDLDEKYTISPDTFAYEPASYLGGADIAIVVKYQPWFLPIRRQKVFRFVTHNNHDGTFSWYSYPLK